MAVVTMVGVACVAGAFVFGIRYEQSYLREVVRRCHDRPLRGAAVSFGFQSLAAVIDICVGAAAHATGHTAVALVMVGPVLIVHGALVLAALPSGYVVGYRDNRRDLRALGISPATARATAWAGGVGVFLFGLPAIVASWLLAVSASHGTA